MIQNWIWALLLLLAASASAVWTFLGGFAQLPEGVVIEGENGAGIAVPNYAEVWARRLVFYYNATETARTYYEYSPAYYRVGPGYTWNPDLVFLFTVRSGKGPLVKSFKPFGTTTAKFGGGVKANLTLYDAEPGESRIYVVLIEVRGGIWVEDPEYPSPPWEKITSYGVYKRFSGVVKKAPGENFGATVVSLYVYDISPDVIRQRRGGPTGLFGYIPESREVYEWVYSVRISKFPDFVEVVAFPNGTLKFTFYGLYQRVYNWTDHMEYFYPVNVTLSINLGGDLWIWVGPEYPSAVIAADVDPWNFERVVYYLPWAFHYLLFVPSTYYTKSLIVEVGAEEFAVFLGNGTLAVPPLAYPLYAGVGAFGRADGFVYVAEPSSKRPGRGYQYGCVRDEWFMGTCPFGKPAKPLWDLRGKTAEICFADNGTCKTVPAGVLFSPPPGYSANGTKTPLGYAAVGKTYIHKPYYNVTVVLPNGSLVFTRPWGSLFNFSYPDVYLKNGTALANFSKISLRVLGDAVVRLNYTVYHRVAVETPFGTNETWAKRGSIFRFSGADVVFGNGTRVVVHPAEVYVDRPLVVRPNYTVYYWVVLLAPDGPREFWAERGSAVSYRHVINYSDKAKVVYTASAVARGPLVLRPNYTVYYKVVVEEAGGLSEFWAEAGSRFSYKPRLFDPGNGTRLIPLGDCEFVVNMSTVCRVPYKRQYYVRVVLLNGTWEGWADEGAVLQDRRAVSGPLGKSGAYQLLYEAAQVVDKPGEYAVRYRVRGWAYLADPLAVPVPFAEVRACGAAFRTDWRGRAEVEAEAATLCAVEASAPPVSPYTAAAAGGVVLAARKAKKQGGKKKLLLGF
ncbi:hypothetical protein [Pyrobaculum sp.]|uniref:hypothetical protein n=1 Tax=Pyrobaculum sp. TaxID=2004705 RepID=UPI00316686C8